MTAAPLDPAAIKAAHHLFVHPSGNPWPSPECDECSGDWPCDTYRLAAELVKAQEQIEQLQNPGPMRIWGTWLVETFNECTCGAGPGGYYDAHEPQCGMAPVMDLSQVEGFAEEVLAPVWDEGYRSGGSDNPSRPVTLNPHRASA